MLWDCKECEICKEKLQVSTAVDGSLRMVNLDTDSAHCTAHPEEITGWLNLPQSNRDKIIICTVERSENTLFWKLQKAHMVYGPRHNTDFRTIDEIIIG